MTHKQHLQNLLAQGKIAQVIKELLEATEKNGQRDLNSALLLLSARFNRNEKSQRMGILSRQEYTIENNQITAALLAYWDDYEEKKPLTEIENTHSHNDMLNVNTEKQVIFDTDDAVDAPQHIERFENGYALFIGIQYAHWKGGGMLPGTLRDVNDLYAHFTDGQKAAYLPENIHLLREEEATAANIFQALGQLATKANLNKDATVMVYFSGHGETDGKHHFLVPYDFDVQKWRSTRTFDADKVVLSKDFTQALDRIQAKKCLIVLDCCHAADMPADKSINTQPAFWEKFLADVPAAPLTEKSLGGHITQGKGRVILTSCQGEEKSLDIGTNGLFTKVLLDSLMGVDNLKKDGWVRLIDLIDYVPKTVAAKAATLGHVQHPVFKRIEDLGTEEFVVCAYDIGRARGITNVKPQITHPHTQNKNILNAFKNKLLHLLDEQQQNSIADILAQIKDSGYEYDKVKYKTLENALNPMSLAMMARELVESTKVLINSIQ